MENKTYKDFEQLNLGASDSARLVVVDGSVHPHFLEFGEDGIYKAYLVPTFTEIPESYEPVLTTFDYLLVYDDDRKTVYLKGDYTIYRCGDFGCIIQKHLTPGEWDEIDRISKEMKVWE